MYNYTVMIESIPAKGTIENSESHTFTSKQNKAKRKLNLNNKKKQKYNEIRIFKYDVMMISIKK